jgi:hypothetical protein
MSNAEEDHVVVREAGEEDEDDQLLVVGDDEASRASSEDDDDESVRSDSSDDAEDPEDAIPMLSRATIPSATPLITCGLPRPTIPSTSTTAWSPRFEASRLRRFDGWRASFPGNAESR